MDGWFTKEQTGFWGSLALMVTAYFKYKTASMKRKDENMTDETQKLGDENIKLALGDINAVAAEIAKVAKDGIQVKDAEVIVEDIISSAELRAHITNFVNHAKLAIPEVKDIDIVEGFDVAKFEYDGVKGVIDILKS